MSAPGSRTRPTSRQGWSGCGRFQSIGKERDSRQFSDRWTDGLILEQKRSCRFEEITGLSSTPSTSLGLHKAVPWWVFKLVTTGQLVVNRLQANNGLVFCSRLNGLVSPDYSVFEMRRPLNMEYLSDLLRTSIYRAHFRREATGLGTGTAGFLRLYDDKFLETPVFLPSAQEQVLIRDFLASHVADVGRVIDQVQRQISLFGEFRIRLIADIVTGKLDIREAAARLPDNIGDLESLASPDAQAGVVAEAVGQLDATN